MLAAAAVAGALAALIVTLGHGGGSHTASAAAGPASAATTVQAFGTALETRDFKTICDKLFTSHARAALGGPDCASMLAANAELLSKPRVRVREVTVRGANATATISVRQQHQARMIEVLQLTRQAGSFRIAGVTSPGE